MPTFVSRLSRFVLVRVVFVAVPPDIINDDTSGDLSVSEGENATLWCRATGHPTPRIAWKREDGQPIMIRKGARDIQRGKRPCYTNITPVLLHYNAIILDVSLCHRFIQF
jgi:hypothetical protein